MATIDAYLVHSWRRPADLEALGQEVLVHELGFSGSDMSHIKGWLKVGTADITVHLLSEGAMVASELAALTKQREEAAKAFADTVRAIDDRITKLTAIGCEVQA